MLIALTTVWGYGTWQDFYWRHRLITEAHRLESLFHFAREQAMFRSETIELCNSHDDLNCDSHSSQWTGDWLVRGLESQALKVSSKIAPPFRLSWVAGLDLKKELSFDSNGFTSGQQGSFYFCAPSNSDVIGIALIVLRSGRLRLSSDYSKLPKFCG